MAIYVLEFAALACVTNGQDAVYELISSPRQYLHLVVVDSALRRHVVVSPYATRFKLSILMKLGLWKLDPESVGVQLQVTRHLVPIPTGGERCQGVLVREGGRPLDYSVRHSSVGA